MKKTTKTIVEEFNNEGKLIKKTETTMTEEDNNTYENQITSAKGLNIPKNPYHGYTYVGDIPGTCLTGNINNEITELK